LGTLVSQSQDSQDGARRPVKDASVPATKKNDSPGQGAAKPAARKNAAPATRTGSEAIEAALQRRVPCAFVETPLKDVVDFLKDAAKIEIWIDKEGLREEGLDANLPVNCDVRDCRLENLLHLILDGHHLGFGIHNDVLWITSESNSHFVETRTYDVADLVIYKDEKGQTVDDYDPLIDVISQIVSPPTWDHNGGNGSISGASLGTAKVLVVSQSREVHREIEDLLSQIRAIAAKKSAGGELPRKAAASHSNDKPKPESPPVKNQQSS
jgi:hypothetical protein